MHGTSYIDDVMPLSVAASRFSTGEAYDATGSVTYRVYEQDTATPILTGSLSLFDGSNTNGFYLGTITLSAANGFEVGKYYTVHAAATVDSVAAEDIIARFRVCAVPGTSTITVAEIWDAVLDTWDPSVLVTTYGELFSFLRVLSYYAGRDTGNIGYLCDETDTAIAQYSFNSTDTGGFRSRPTAI